MRKLYKQRVGVSTDSLCEMLCSLKTLLLVYGFSTSVFGLVQVYSLQTTCMNYIGIAMIWTIFEIVSYFAWIVVSLASSSQYSQRVDQWFDHQVCRLAGLDESDDVRQRNASRSPTCAGQQMKKEAHTPKKRDITGTAEKHSQKKKSNSKSKSPSQAGTKPRQNSKGIEY